jgi:hypothetical protein
MPDGQFGRQNWPEGDHWLRNCPLAGSTTRARNGYTNHMPKYRVNDDAVKHARRLIDAGDYDDKTEWSEAAPSAADANKEIDRESFAEFAKWHLAIDVDASEGTKGSVAFPYGDFKKVNRAALIHAKQRASQNDHDAVEKAADDLLQYLDRKRS